MGAGYWQLTSGVYEFKFLSPVYFSENIVIALADNRCVVDYAGPAHSESDGMMMAEPDGGECPNFCVRGGLLNSSLLDFL